MTVDFSSDFPLARYIDQTLLQPALTEEEVEVAAEKALEMGFAALCVPPSLVKAAASVLGFSGVAVITVAGFPLGFQTTQVKCLEAEEAVRSGAGEIDMVINRGWVRAGRFDRVEKEIRAVVGAVAPAPVKAILEISDLNLDETLQACDRTVRAGARYIKTSTGFFGAGADTATVRAIRDRVGDRIQIKASGGIRTLESVLEMIQAGADRIGTSSGEAILDEWTALVSSRTGTNRKSG